MTRDEDSCKPALLHTQELRDIGSGVMEDERQRLTMLLDSVSLQHSCLKTIEFEWAAIPPFSFERTINQQTRYGADWFWQTPGEEFRDGVLYSAIRLEDETPIGVALRSAGTEAKPSVHVTLFSETRLTQAEVKVVQEHLVKGLALDLDLSPFYRIAANYPLLQLATEHLRGMRATPLLDLFSRIVLAILLQNTSSGRTDRMLSALCASFGERVVFDTCDICLIPKPSVVIDIPEEVLRRVCKVGYRAKFLIGSARALVAEEIPSLGELERLPTSQAHKRLLQLPGIGDYAAAIVTPHPAFPVDIWSAKLFRHVFGIPASGDSRHIVSEIKRQAREAFGEWQHYAYAYLIEDWDRLITVVGE